MYVVSELLKQVEGFKAEGNNDASTDALNALRGAMQDVTSMQVKVKNGIADYLKKYVNSAGA